MRGTINANDPAIIDRNATASIPLADQPVRLNGAIGALPANSSALSDTDFPSSRENSRVTSEQSGIGTNDDPFLAPGFRMGTSIANLTLEQSIGTSSNASQTTNGGSSLFYQTNFAFDLRSDWTRHELTLDVDGTYQSFADGTVEDRPTVGLGANLRLDLADGFSSILRATYNYSTESLTNSNLGANVTAQPGVHTYLTSAELIRNDSKLNFNLRGAITRSLYDAAATTTGTLSQLDRDNVRYGLRARVSYDNGAALRPFAQIGGAILRYDQEVDRNGDQRNSSVYEMRAGIELDMGEKLTGELGVGYIAETFDEGSLANLDGITIDGALNWSPERGTIVTANVSTSLNGATTSGDNGSIIYAGALSAVRQVTDRVSLNLNAGVRFNYDEERDETDATYTIGTGARYWMSRYMALSASVGFTRFESSDGLDDYDETTALLGVVFQR